jgi:hypothetical protein
METSSLVFQLSEANEQVVRTYECTKLKRWLQPATIGYLTVTNKRIVFHSSGKSITGRSVLVNEMPLDDATGISLYEGTSINWFVFIVMTIIAYIATQILMGILPEFVRSWPFAVLLMLPYALLVFIKSNYASEALKTQTLETLDKLTQAKTAREIVEYTKYVQIPFYIGLLILVWVISTGGILGIRGMAIGSIVLIATYVVIFFLLFGRHQSFSLAIGSKAAKEAAIYIPGDSFRLFFRGNTTALESLEAGPAADANLIIRELGAMLLDIKILGDHGIEKWRNQPNSISIE